MSLCRDILENGIVAVSLTYNQIKVYMETELIQRLLFSGLVVCWFLFFITFLYQALVPTHPGLRRSRSLLGSFLQILGFVVCIGIQRPVFVPLVNVSFFFQWFLGVISLALGFSGWWLIVRAHQYIRFKPPVRFEPAEPFRLVREGPYGVIRHPMIVGWFLLLFATGITVSSWTGFIMGIVFFVWGTYIHLIREEKILSDIFGQAFEQYRTDIPPFIPKL